ncbi:lipoyl(octanoyl) transferase LipB [Pseudomonadota bacterium]
MHTDNVTVRQLGLREYTPVWQAMQAYTDQRQSDWDDEIWLVEHPPVFTLGFNGKPEHLLNPGDTPVINIDRGGQVTYHGPGQQVAYLLIDIKRRKLGVRAMVERIEQAIIELLAEFNIQARGRRDAPGVYVDDAKIAALGLRIRRGCSYHGLALNIAMDLEPFTRINPCGYAGMAVTQISDLGGPSSLSDVSQQLCQCLARQLGYNTFNTTDEPSSFL